MADTPVRTINGVDAPAPGVWRLDPSHTEVAFVARYMMLTKVRGRFGRFAGEVHVEEEPEKSWVDVEVETASIDTGNPDRDGHLKSPDFLDVDRFPTMRFRSSNVELAGGTKLRVAGDLTIRDVTRPVVLDVELEGVGRDPWGGTRMAFSASARIDRTEFGASWNVMLEAGGVLVGKDVEIQIDGQAIYQAAASEKSAAA